MSRLEKPVPGPRRTQRVVSLPCGHQVYVGSETTLLGASGPVLDHQASCRGPAATSFAAWFVPVPIALRPREGDAAGVDGPSRFVAAPTV